MMKNQSNLKWYQSELNKDKKELDKQKLKFINEIKKLKKDDIVPKTDKKISIWRRILKVLAI
jgi:hypothetical protein